MRPRLIRKAYDKIKNIGKRSKNYLLNGDIINLGKEMELHWRVKKTITETITNNHLDPNVFTVKVIRCNWWKNNWSRWGGIFNDS